MPAIAPSSPSPVSHAAAVQYGLAAGAGARCDRTELSSSIRLLWTTEAITSMSSDQATTA